VTVKVADLVADAVDTRRLSLDHVDDPRGPTERSLAMLLLQLRLRLPALAIALPLVLIAAG